MDPPYFSYPSHFSFLPQNFILVRATLSYYQLYKKVNSNFTSNVVRQAVIAADYKAFKTSCIEMQFAPKRKYDFSEKLDIFLRIPESSLQIILFQKISGKPVLGEKVGDLLRFSTYWDYLKFSYKKLVFFIQPLHITVCYENNNIRSLPKTLMSAYGYFYLLFSILEYLIACW